MGRRHRGVAAIAVVMPKVFIVQRRDQVGFGYAFYPIRNPHFAGENPIRLGSAEDFDPSLRWVEGVKLGLGVKRSK